MKNRIAFAACSALCATLLSGCVSFYPSPKDDEPAATMLEQADRTGLVSYTSVDVGEIDGLPVSHMLDFDQHPIRIGTGRHTVAIRITWNAPGTVGQTLLGRTPCPCDSWYVIQGNFHAGQAFKLEGTVNDMVGTLRILDVKSGLEYLKIDHELTLMSRGYKQYSQSGASLEAVALPDTPSAPTL